MLCITLEKFDEYVSENPVIDHALRKAAHERAKIFCPPPGTQTCFGGLDDDEASALA